MDSSVDAASSDTYIYIAIAAFMIIMCTRTEQLRYRREREEDEEIARQAEAAKRAKEIDPEERKKEIESALIVKEIGVDGIVSETDEESEPEKVSENLDMTPEKDDGIPPVEGPPEPGHAGFLPQRFRRGKRNTRRAPFSSSSATGDAPSSASGLTVRSLPLYQRVGSGDEEDVELGLSNSSEDDAGVDYRRVELSSGSSSASDTSVSSDDFDVEEGHVAKSDETSYLKESASLQSMTMIECGQDMRGQLNEDSTCSICLLGYEEGDKVAWSRNPSCQHAFHEECLVPWLMQHSECPYCRSSYFCFDKTNGEEPTEEEQTAANGATPANTRPANHSYVSYLLQSA